MRTAAIATISISSARRITRTAWMSTASRRTRAHSTATGRTRRTPKPHSCIRRALTSAETPPIPERRVPERNVRIVCGDRARGVGVPTCVRALGQASVAAWSCPTAGPVKPAHCIATYNDLPLTVPPALCVRANGPPSRPIAGSGRRRPRRPSAVAPGSTVCRRPSSNRSAPNQRRHHRPCLATAGRPGASTVPCAPMKGCK
jgi:hypothetical protein